MMNTMMNTIMTLIVTYVTVTAMLMGAVVGCRHLAKRDLVQYKYRLAKAGRKVQRAVARLRIPH